MDTYTSAKQKARQTLKPRYGVSIGAYALFYLLTSAVSDTFDILDELAQHHIDFLGSFIWAVYDSHLFLPIVLLILIFVAAPTTVGYSGFTLRVVRQEPASIRDMFHIGFARDYWRSVVGMLWRYLFILLWTLLLIIPGIIKAYAYSMTPYILADCPDVSATDSLRLSMRMTKGYKSEIFILGLSFIGWRLLSVLTLGLLGFFYVEPYYHTSMAAMYDQLKTRALEDGTIAPDELGGNVQPRFVIPPREGDDS